MNENELRERYIRLAFQYESAIDALLTKGLIDMEALKRDWFIWDKVFKPYVDEKLIDTVFRLI